MIPSTHKLWACLFVQATLVMLLVGCSTPPTPPKEEKKTAQAAKKHDHPEKGPHGGPLVEWGDEDFHVECTIDASSKRAIFYILDGEAKKAPKDDPAKFSEVKMTIVKPKLVLELKHDPALSGEKGIAFAATHDAFAKNTGFAGTISGKYADKEPYNGDFTIKASK